MMPDARGIPIGIGLVWGVAMLGSGIEQLRGIQPPRWINKNTGEYVEPLKTPQELANDGFWHTVEGVTVLLATLAYTIWVARSLRN